MIPDDLRYTDKHEWVRVEGDIATVGITDYAQTQLGDIVYVELPSVGTRVEAAAAFGTIEAVKAVSDLYSPVSGRIIEVNTMLPDALEVFSSDPYGAGWVIKVEMTDESPMDELMDFKTYQQQCAEEA